MSGLSEEMLKVIRGQVKPEEKLVAYDSSLQRWWSEYAARKNDEEEEHVADSLLYDERCHLPRTTPRPEFLNEPSNAVSQGAAQTGDANGVHANGENANGQGHH